MHVKSSLSLTLLVLLIAACSAPVASPAIAITAMPTTPRIEGNSTPYPPPTASVNEHSLPPSSPTSTLNMGANKVPLSGFEPQPGDAKLERDQVMLDMANSALMLGMSQPVQVRAVLTGTLSDPCHQLRVVVSPPSAQNEINLEAYTVFDPSQMCIMVIKPFTVTIPLGSYSGGHFSVFVNGQLIGEFDA